MKTLLLALGICLTAAMVVHAQSEPIVVGSKNFTEGYVLAELVAQTLEAHGIPVERRFGLGGTLVCYEALTTGEIDVYPEYSGTLEQAILKLPRSVGVDSLRVLLRKRHRLDFVAWLGFNNTYAIALKSDLARSRALRSISDLAGHPDLRLAFSHEFNQREDGWPGLKQRYALPQTPAGIEHGLAYQAIEQNKIDITDVYSTDGDIEKYGLVTLADDRNYFPQYLAGVAIRADLAPRVITALNTLAGSIDESTMIAMNADVLLRGKSFAEVAKTFLAQTHNVETSVASESRWRQLRRRTIRHLLLTGIALAMSILIAVPLGIVVYRAGRGAQVITYVAGAMQTIPSIALLAFMIPILGIGVAPAIAALFVYALLPILRNTTTALQTVDPVVRRVAEGMGLSVIQRLRHVELPLAAPTILAGVKTAAVINIGTATLAAFIGAGGLGEPIVTGLALNDTRLILEGAVQAAVLAIATELLFDAIERVSIPAHLR